MIKGFPYLEKFKSPEELKQAYERAKSEQHGLFFPTHAVKKSGEVFGYFSVAHPAAAIVFAWLGKALTSRESFQLINTVESLVAAGGGEAVCLPIPKNSPFFPLMEEMGYKHSGEYTFFVKEL